MSNIEYINGQESHSSSWGKYYVKGLENWGVKEDFSENRQDKHHSYQGFAAIEIPEGAIFTVFEQSGDKRGTDTYVFTVCQAVDDCFTDDVSGYGSGKCTGNFKILVRAATKTTAPRLMQWWINSPVKTLEFAQHCANYITKRGIKELPPMP